MHPCSFSSELPSHWSAELPYALVGIYGDVTRGKSRLLFPSQFGVLLLIATVIQCVPFTRLRAAIAGGTIVLFALSMAHDTKSVAL